MNNHKCPACGCSIISVIADYVRNSVTFRCDYCGETYSCVIEGSYSLPADVVFDAWHEDFSNQKSIEDKAVEG